MFYILNQRGKVVRTATAVFDTALLRSAGYTVVESAVSLSIDSLEVQGFPAKPVIVKKARPVLPRIALATTAEDKDGDGIPEIPADGKSKRGLLVSLHDSKGAILDKAVEVSFRVTAGTISHRKVTTTNGKATVQFTASHETVTAAVYAFAEGFTPAYLNFEFVPKENYKR